MYGFEQQRTAPPTQSARVERSRISPCRAKIYACRYSGRWSAYFDTITCATPSVHAVRSE